MLEINIKEEYKFDNLNIETESEKQQAIELANEKKKHEIALKKAAEDIEKKEREEEDKEQ